jgi:hypothetical protein
MKFLFLSSHVTYKLYGVNNTVVLKFWKEYLNYISTTGCHCKVKTPRITSSQQAAAYLAIQTAGSYRTLKHT